MMFRVSIKALRIFVPAFLLLCTGASAPARERAAIAASSPVVHIGNFVFEPAKITIAPGTTLTWVNRDDIPHTVAATNKEFRSKPMDTDQTFSFTFTAPGTYDYFCSLHPHMNGKVIVK